MKRRAVKHSPRLWLAAGLVAVSLPLAACQQKAAVAHQAEHPAEVEATEVPGINRVTFTERALERIDVGTTEVREQRVSRSDAPRKVVPQSALIYGPRGETWIYTSPQPRVFIRQLIDVDYVEAGLVVLNDGPPVGTVVASRAVAELYGADFGVGH